jgi:hypothetical protein
LFAALKGHMKHEHYGNDDAVQDVVRSCCEVPELFVPQWARAALAQVRE